jgi:hypothetical protein
MLSIDSDSTNRSDIVTNVIESHIVRVVDIGIRTRSIDADGVNLAQWSQRICAERTKAIAIEFVRDHTGYNR